METERGAKAEALPLKGFPFPSPIRGLPGVLAMPALRSCRMRVQLAELVPRFGARHGRVLHPGKAKGANSEPVPAPPGTAPPHTESTHTTREPLNLLIKLRFSVGDQGFAVY